MKTNPLTLHLAVKHSHSNLILFHVGIAAITQSRGGYMEVMWLLLVTSLCMELLPGSS